MIIDQQRAFPVRRGIEIDGKAGIFVGDDDPNLATRDDAAPGSLFLRTNGTTYRKRGDGTWSDLGNDRSEPLLSQMFFKRAVRQLDFLPLVGTPNLFDWMVPASGQVIGLSGQASRIISGDLALSMHLNGVAASAATLSFTTSNDPVGTALFGLDIPITAGDRISLRASDDPGRAQNLHVTLYYQMIGA